MSISMTIAEVSYWCEHSSLTSDQCSIPGIDAMRELEYVTFLIPTLWVFLRLLRCLRVMFNEDANIQKWFTEGSSKKLLRTHKNLIIETINRNIYVQELKVELKGS